MKNIQLDLGQLKDCAKCLPPVNEKIMFVVSHNGEDVNIFTGVVQSVEKGYGRVCDVIDERINICSRTNKEGRFAIGVKGHYRHLLVVNVDRNNSNRKVYFTAESVGIQGDF